MRNLTMTIPQFNAYNRGEITLKEIKEINEGESFAKWILNDNKLTKCFVFVVGGLNYASVVMAETTDAMARVNMAGNMFLGIIQTIAFWLCLIGAIIEILKCVANGSSKDIGRILMKYLLIFASVYLLPFAFDLIRDIFK